MQHLADLAVLEGGTPADAEIDPDTLIEFISSLSDSESYHANSRLEQR